MTMNTSSSLRLLRQRVGTLLGAACLCTALSAQSDPTPNHPNPNSPSNAPTQTAPDLTVPDRTARQAGANSDLKHSDKSFMEKAAKAGQKEVAVSQIALERATNPKVREFAQMMVDDHGQANGELTQLASGRGLALPVTTVKTDKWTDKKAANFDKDYVDEMVDDHQEAVSLFEKAAKSDDPAVAAFAQRYLPKLQEHLAHAKQLKAAY